MTLLKLNNNAQKNMQKNILKKLAYIEKMNILIPHK